MESVHGKGSVFQVFLPQTEATVLPKTSVGEELPRGTERVLFVDDEESITKLAVQVLERQGYRVVGLTESMNALKQFEEKPEVFDLVISDMAMPHMAGDRLARELLKIRADIPIILCTGHSERIDVEKAKTMSIRAFMMKPLSVTELARTVREVLDKAKG